MVRSCFIIGPTKLCGDTAIIGSNCPRSPFWTVSCSPIALEEPVCLTDPFVDSPPAALVLSDQTNLSGTLEEPEVLVFP